MTAVATDRGAVLAEVMRVLVPVEALTFFLAALLHLGVQIPLGFAIVSQPRIIPAAIVESLCGLALAISAYAMFTRGIWARAAAIAAHTLALAGVLLGMVALAVGRGPRTELNDTYHQVMLVLLVAGLVFLRTPSANAALSRRAS